MGKRILIGILLVASLFLTAAVPLPPGPTWTPCHTYTLHIDPVSMTRTITIFCSWTENKEPLLIGDDTISVGDGWTNHYLVYSCWMAMCGQTFLPAVSRP